MHNKIETFLISDCTNVKAKLAFFDLVKKRILFQRWTASKKVLSGSLVWLKSLCVRLLPYALPSFDLPSMFCTRRGRFSTERRHPDLWKLAWRPFTEYKTVLDQAKSGTR